MSRQKTGRENGNADDEHNGHWKSGHRGNAHEAPIREPQTRPKNEKIHDDEWHKNIFEGQRENVMTVKVIFGGEEGEDAASCQNLSHMHDQRGKHVAVLKGSGHQ